MTLFLDKVLEARKDTFAKSLELAQELEAIEQDYKCSQKNAAVKAELQPEEANTIIWEQLTKDKIEQVAALCARNNCYPPKNSPNGPACNSGPPRNNSTQNPNIICRYCDKKGHRQKECYSRIRNNSPMVIANGKAYESSLMNKVADKHNDWDAEPQYEDAHMRAIANLSPYHHLNWQAILTQLQLRIAHRPVLMMEYNFCTLN